VYRDLFERYGADDVANRRQDINKCRDPVESLVLARRHWSATAAFMFMGLHKKAKLIILSYRLLAVRIFVMYL
jgi:hypothetical protein